MKDLAKADIELMGFIYGWREKHALSYADVLYLLAKYAESILRVLINDAARNEGGNADTILREQT